MRVRITISEGAGSRRWMRDVTTGIGRRNLHQNMGEEVQVLTAEYLRRLAGASTLGKSGRVTIMRAATTKR